MSDANAHIQTPQHPVAGDQSAARELQRVLSLYLPSFYRCALRILGNRDDAEDAVQEALLAAHKHLHQFRGQSQMSTWLTTIVCNCARMQLRKRPRQVHMPLEEQTGGEEGYFIFEELADPRPSPEDECRNSELTAHLKQCTTLLSPKLRRTFQLRVVDGLSIPETAKVLGVPHGIVKAQLARARAKIARHMRRALAPRRRTARDLRLGMVAKTAITLEYYLPQKFPKQREHLIPPAPRRSIMRFPCLIATQSRSSPVFDFGTSNNHKFISIWWTRYLDTCLRTGFGCGRSRLFLMASLTLTRPVITSLTLNVTVSTASTL